MSDLEEANARLSGVTADTFEPSVTETFEIVFSDGVIPVELVSVDRLEKRSPPGRREPFSLVFRASSDRIIPQMNWTVRNASTGEQTFLAVPIGVDETGALYQVIFN